MFAISKLSYGWITRLPTWTTCKSIWSAIGRGSRRMRAASPFLKGVLWGGNCHPDVVCATRLIGILGRIRQVRELAWPARPGQPLYVLHKWLLARDWTLVRPLVWSHPLLVEELSLEIVVPIGARQHLIRDAWRGWMLTQHAAGIRRDAGCVNELLVNGSWSNIDWRRVRNWTLGFAEARTVASGASFSPAALQGLTGRPLACCWPGCQELGTWEHIAWTCSRRPPVPSFHPHVLA